MLEYAEFSFTLAKTDQQGVSLREHLEQIERQTGKTPKDLEEPDFPYLVSHIWSAFICLSATRGSSMAGPLPISYTEIKAWSELTNTKLSVVEVDAIRSLDSAYLRILNGDD